jgi:hypothetical protein
MSLASSLARTKGKPVERETEEVLIPWEEVGGRGLDTWFELPAWYAMPDGSSGKPGGGYDYSSLVEDYLATLDTEEEDHDDEYETWLKRLFDQMRGRQPRRV